MESILVSDAARVLGSTVVGGAGSATARSVCTDTRETTEGALFFALPGERTDGHRFVARAFELGAIAAVVTAPQAGVVGQQIVVSDTVAALGALAAWYRKRFKLTLVGVSGSVGKTSTRAMIAQVLGDRMPTLASARNYNNEIGVPRTLFELTPEHRAAVVEMAMRGPGQIADLARMAVPSIGVITNIGMSHIELLGSRDGIAAAKGELLEALPGDGLAILPCDDDYTDTLRSLCPCRSLTFGMAATADYRATDIRFRDDGAARFEINGTTVALATPGVHHIPNAAAAFAVGAEFGITPPAIAESLARFAAPAGRMRTLAGPNGMTIIDDTYNAAPDSMLAAVQTLWLLAGRRRTIAVLGDMRELGKFSVDAHRLVGRTLGASRVDLLVTVGELAQEIGRTARSLDPDQRTVEFGTSTEAAEALPAVLRADDVVLVKGSRAMEMERIVRAIGVPEKGANDQCKSDL